MTTLAYRRGIGGAGQGRVPCKEAPKPFDGVRNTWAVQRICRGRLVAASAGKDEGPTSSIIPDSLPVAGPETDWRAFRARLAAMEAGSDMGGAVSFSEARWAHALAIPETGCILLAHPSMFGLTQTYFRQAAILILEHSETGALGIILNRPTDHTLNSVRFSAEQLMGPFRDNKLYMGGDVGESSVIVVTTSEAVTDSTRIAPGIRVCTISAASAAVRAGIAHPSEFRFFAQYSGWGPGQLERECRAGVWFVASVSSPLALNEKLAKGPELWHEILKTMGGPHAELSRLVSDGESRSSPKDRGDEFI